MNFYGKIGYIEKQVEKSPGVYTNLIVERPYYGKLNKIYARQQPRQDSVNNEINLSNELSIIADPYAREHFASMVYVWLHGVQWSITSVDASNPPRLTLQIGGEYHGPQKAPTARNI